MLDKASRFKWFVMQFLMLARIKFFIRMIVAVSQSSVWFNTLFRTIRQISAVINYICFLFFTRNTIRQSQVLQYSVCSNRTSQAETYLLKCLCTHRAPSTVMARHLVCQKTKLHSDRMVPMLAPWKDFRTILKIGTSEEASRDGETWPYRAAIRRRWRQGNLDGVTLRR